MSFVFPVERFGGMDLRIWDIWRGYEGCFPVLTLECPKNAYWCPENALAAECLSMHVLAHKETQLPSVNGKPFE